MKKISVYVVGVLEHIAQERGKIVVRIKCRRKFRVYEDEELEASYNEKLYGEYTLKELILSHPVAAFNEGDAVKLTCLRDRESKKYRYILDNQTLLNACGLEELLPKKLSKYLFSVEVKAALDNICCDKSGNVILRLKCSEKKYVFFDGRDVHKYHTKTYKFDKFMYGVIEKKYLRLDIGVNLISGYKKGDVVRLSRPCEIEGYDLINVTLSVDHNKPNYKTKWALKL